MSPALDLQLWLSSDTHISEDDVMLPVTLSTLQTDRLTAGVTVNMPNNNIINLDGTALIVNLINTPVAKYDLITYPKVKMIINLSFASTWLFVTQLYLACQ